MRIGSGFMYDPEQAVFEEQPESNIEIAYGIEDVPKPLWKAILFSTSDHISGFHTFYVGSRFCFFSRDRST